MSTKPTCPHCGSPQRYHLTGSGIREFDCRTSVLKDGSGPRTSLCYERQIEGLERWREDHLRIQRVCDGFFHDAIRPLLHLWDEAQRPPGIQMICDKFQEKLDELAAKDAEIQRLRDALTAMQERKKFDSPEKAVEWLLNQIHYALNPIN